MAKIFQNMERRTHTYLIANNGGYLYRCDDTFKIQI